VNVESIGERFIEGRLEFSEMSRGMKKEEVGEGIMIESGPGDIFHPLGEDVEDFVWWHGVGSWQRQRDWIPLRRLGGIDAVRGDRPVGESREGAKGECKGKVGRGGM
jgi:hypothetical protein